MKRDLTCAKKSLCNTNYLGRWTWWFYVRQFTMKDRIEYPEANAVPCSKIYISPSGCEISGQREQPTRIWGRSSERREAFKLALKFLV